MSLYNTSFVCDPKWFCHLKIFKWYQWGLLLKTRSSCIAGLWNTYSWLREKISLLKIAKNFIMKLLTKNDPVLILLHLRQRVPWCSDLDIHHSVSFLSSKWVKVGSCHARPYWLSLKCDSCGGYLAYIIFRKIWNIHFVGACMLNRSWKKE